MGYRLGVDLGTTFTAAAIRRDGVSRMATLGLRQSEMPSVVAVTGADVRVGDDAEYYGRTEPASVVRFFKRRFADSTPLVVNGQPWSAEALSARVLQRVLRDVTEAEGSAPDHVVLTHPAGWREFRLDAMHSMAEIAEVSSYHLVSEPVAAARHYAESNRLPNDARLAVFDFGGGTFDTSVVSVTDGEFAVIGTPQGIDRLGGIDIDEAVFSYVCESAGIDPYELPDTAPITRDLQRVRRECRDAKEILSSAQVARIAVRVGGVDADVDLTREQFETMLIPMLSDAGAAVDRAIRGVGLGLEEIDALLLVGGSSRIPAVRDALSERFGRPILVDTHPKHAVALGAVLSDPPTTVVPPHTVPIHAVPIDAAASTATEQSASPVAPPTPPERPGGRPPVPGVATVTEAAAPSPGHAAIDTSVPNQTVPNQNVLDTPGGGALAPGDGGAGAPRVAATSGSSGGSKAPLAIALVLSALVIAGGLGYLLTRDSGEPEEAVATTQPEDDTLVDDATTTTTSTPTTTTTSASESGSTTEAGSTSTIQESDGQVIVPAGELIQIRLLGDVSGNFVDIGQSSAALSQQALEDFGPVRGFDVEFGTVLDTACSEEQGRTVAATVAESPDVIGVIGPQCSSSILGASPAVTGLGAVLIAPTGAWPTLTSDHEGFKGADHNDGFYRLVHSDLVHPIALADYATRELQVSRAGIVHLGVDFELELAAAFVHQFEASGGEVAIIQNLGAESTVETLGENFIDADVDFIYVLVPSSEAAGVLAALDEQGDWTLGGSQYLFDEQVLSDPASVDMVLTAPKAVDLVAINEVTNRSGTDVLAEFEASGGQTGPSGSWARSYDATLLLLLAIEAGSTVEEGNLVIDRDGVRRYLDDLSGFSGLSGPITCDDFGDCARSPILIVRNVDPTDFNSVVTLEEFDDFG